MIKKLLTTSLVGLTLMMSGCGDDTEGEDRLGIQQMLDTGNYIGVISKLESSADSADDYIALGAAYMGKAGLSLSDIVTAMVNSTDDNDNDSAFAGFVTSVSSVSTPTALTDLRKSINYYKRVVESGCMDPNAQLSNTEKDICLYIGLASTSSAAVTIDLIAGDIADFGESGSSDDKLTASVCALQYGADDRNDSNVDASCSIEEGNDVNFTVINKIYTDLNVTVNGETYYYLLNDINQTVLTKNYCTATDFSTRTATYVSTTPEYYACPIVETSGVAELTTASVLVDILNNGIGAISSAASEDTQSDIDEFKCEILGGDYDGTDCNVSLTNDVTEQNIIDFLNSQN